MTEEAENLKIFIDNNYELYKSRLLPIRNNLIKKKKKGIFDKNLAPKAFYILVNEGAKMYQKANEEYNEEKQKPISAEVKRETAKEFAEEFDEEYQNGEYE